MGATHLQMKQRKPLNTKQQTSINVVTDSESVDASKSRFVASNIGNAGYLVFSAKGSRYA